MLETIGNTPLARNTLVEQGGYIYLNQFNNPHASVGYEKMGREILDQPPKSIDAICGMVGTSGMIMGVGTVVRAKWPDANIVALEPESSAVLSGGQAGTHGIDGTGAGLNVVVALQLAKEVEKGGVVATTACDTGFKYLNGMLYSD